MSAECRSCGAPIEWTVTEAGKRMPIDAEPVEDGTIILYHLEDGAPATAHVLTAAERRSIEEGRAYLVEHMEPEDEPYEPLRFFKSHFATCPNARAHRKVSTSSPSNKGGTA